MHTNGKRGRGRPRGSGLDDRATLTAIATLMARSPGLRATTALRRIDPDVHPATKRRIQSKWNEQGTRLLAEARARLSPAPATNGAPTGGHVLARQNGSSDAFGAMLGGRNPFPQTATQLAAAEVSRRAAAAVDLAAVSASMSSPAMQTMRDVYNSPSMRLMREIHESPSMRLMRQIYDSPGMQLMRRINDDPTSRALRELHESATMRAARGI